MSNNTAIATRQQFDLSPQTFEQALTFSNYLAESDMVPKDFKGKPGNCLVAIQWGMEIGLKPLQAMCASRSFRVAGGHPPTINLQCIVYSVAWQKARAARLVFCFHQLGGARQWVNYQNCHAG